MSSVAGVVIDSLTGHESNPVVRHEVDSCVLGNIDSIVVVASRVEGCSCVLFGLEGASLSALSVWVCSG